MAKVLVSIPDELLQQIDFRAKALGESRSSYLRKLAEKDLEDRERVGREKARRLRELIRGDFGDDEPPANGTQLIREARDSR